MMCNDCGGLKHEIGNNSMQSVTEALSGWDSGVVLRAASATHPTISTADEFSPSEKGAWNRLGNRPATFICIRSLVEHRLLLLYIAR